MEENPQQQGQASMVTRYTRKVQRAMWTAPKTGVLLLNQVRAGKPKNMWDKNPDPVPVGGEKLLHNLLANIMLKHAGDITEKRGQDTIKVGRRIRLIGKKGKMTGPNGLEAEVDLYTQDCPERGFRAGELDHAKMIIEACLRRGLITQEGAWYTFLGERLHGSVNLERKVREDGDFREEAMKLLRGEWSNLPSMVSSEDQEG